MYAKNSLKKHTKFVTVINGRLYILFCEHNVHFPLTVFSPCQFYDISPTWIKFLDIRRFFEHVANKQYII